MTFFVFVIPTQTAPVLKTKSAKEITNSIGMKLMRIPAGKFVMGSPIDEKGRLEDEDQHEVEITKGFSLGVCEVTQGEYEQVMERNPSYFSADGEGKDSVKGIDTSKFPVEQVSYLNAVKFCETLSARAEEKKAGRSYRLPTEAEWEYYAGKKETQPRITRITRIGKMKTRSNARHRGCHGASSYPCYPCNPWFSFLPA